MNGASVGLSELEEAARRGLVQANPALSRLNPLRRIVFHDDFDTGLCGWGELVGNYRGDLDTVGDVYSGLEMEMRPPMLSSLSMWDSGTVGSVDGNYALKIATLPQKGHIAHPVKRLTMGGRGLLQYECWFVVKSEASRLDLSRGTEDFFARRHDIGVPWDPSAEAEEAGGDTAVHSFGFGYDLQDDVERWWPAIRYLHAGKRRIGREMAVARRWRAPSALGWMGGHRGRATAALLQRDPHEA